MSKRKICQSDIIKYINEELHIPHSKLCTVIDSIRHGNITETRISEVKRGKRKGYRELENSESKFYEECFTTKKPDIGFQSIKDFIKRENLIFPNCNGLIDDDYKSYSLRMLKYGLANCNLPSDPKNTVLDEEDYVSIEEPVVEIKEDMVVEENVETSNEISPAANNLYMYKYIKNIRENWTYVFLCFVCITFVSIIFSIYNISAIDIFLWMNNLSPAVFFSLALFIAISTIIFGIVDSSIAVLIYNQKNKNSEKLNYKEIYMIAKYGDIDKIIQGSGRYDLGTSHILYSLFCNITGALCALALYSFLKTLNDFDSFVRSSHFATVANIALLFVLILVFVNSFLLFTREPMEEFHDIVENPDTLRMSRLSVIANNIHIIVNVFFSSMGILFAFIYGFSGYNEKISMSPMFGLVLIGLYSYLWFSSTSPYAVEFNAQCAGSFLLLVPFVSSVTSLYTMMCFYTSASYIISIGINVVAVMVWLVCLLYRGDRQLDLIIKNNKIYFSVYATLLVLFFVILNCI